MNNNGKIYTGLAIFLIILLFPFWYNLGRTAPKPDPIVSARAKKLGNGACVMSTAWIRDNHMLLLNDWRNHAVRDGERVFVNSKGQDFTVSLSNTCLNCHNNADKFCDRCHDYASARPYCWECHIENPKGE